MPAPQPQTIYDKLFTRVSDYCEELRTFMVRNDLTVRSFFRDAEKLKKADFEQGTGILAVLECECGDLEASMAYIQVLHECNLADIHPIDLAITASYKHLRPSVLAPYLQLYAAEPMVYRQENAQQLMVLGAFQHYLDAVAAYEQEGTELDIPIERLRAFAQQMLRSGIREQDAMAIVETAGKVLKQHELRWYDGSPEFTSFDGDVGMWFKVDVSPETAAKLDSELCEQLIQQELDTAPFFVSFVGTAT